MRIVQTSARARVIGPAAIFGSSRSACSTVGKRDLGGVTPQGAFRPDCFPVSSSIDTRHTRVRARVDASNSQLRPE